MHDSVAFGDELPLDERKIDPWEYFYK